MTRALPDLSAKRSVEIGRTAYKAGANRQPGRAAPHGHESYFALPRATAMRAGRRRRQVPPTAFPPVGVPISPRRLIPCGWRALDRALLHAGAVLFFTRARLSTAPVLRVEGGGPTIARATVFTRARNSLHRNEPGSHAMQDDRQSFGSIASIIGVRHPIRMESVDGKVRVEGNSKNSGACRD
jgi:hypothetical protein